MEASAASRRVGAASLWRGDSAATQHRLQTANGALDEADGGEQSLASASPWLDSLSLSREQRQARQRAHLDRGAPSPALLADSTSSRCLTPATQHEVACELGVSEHNARRTDRVKLAAIDAAHTDTQRNTHTSREAKRCRQRELREITTNDRHSLSKRWPMHRHSMSSKTRGRGHAERSAAAATTAAVAAQSTPVEPAAAVASSSPSPDADLSPFVTPGEWRRVCFLICSHCQFLEFPGCAAHTQLYSHPTFVVSPPTTADDEEDRSEGVRRLSMGCGACQDSTENTLPFSSLCRGCHAVRSTAHSMMLCESQLAVLEEAIMHHEIAQLIETAVVHCRQCGAVEFPTVAQINEEIAEEAATETAAATRAASSLEATVAAAFPSSSASSSAAPRAAAASASSSAAPSVAPAAAAARSPAGFLFNKLGEISNAAWLLGSASFAAMQREYEEECRNERMQRARAEEIELRQARERIAQDAPAAAPAEPSAVSFAVPTQEAASSSASSSSSSLAVAVRVPTPFTDAEVAPFVLTALESERFANRLVARCKARFLALHGPRMRHYFACCTGEWSIKLLALSFSECAFLRKHFRATPAPPMTHRYRLHDAARRGDHRALDALLRLPHLAADPQLLRRVINQRDQSGKTCLHIAAFYGRFSCLQLLVNHPLIDLHLLDLTQPKGWTALDHALYWKHGACIKALLWAGAGSVAPYRDLHSLDALVWKRKSGTANKTQSTVEAAASAASTSSSSAEESKSSETASPSTSSSSSSMSAGQSSVALSLLATGPEAVAVAPPAEDHAIIVPAAQPDPPAAVAADPAVGPPAIAMQHLAQAQQRAGDSEDGFSSHAASALGGYPIDPLGLVQAEQGKLMFLLGLHSRVGASSELHRSLACNSAFERNLIRNIFEYTDPFDYSYCLARSAEARHTAEVMVTAPSVRSGGECGSMCACQKEESASSAGSVLDSSLPASSRAAPVARHRCRARRGSIASNTGDMDAAGSLSDPMQPFQVPWASESTAATSASAVAPEPSASNLTIITHVEFESDDESDDDAPTAASTDPDVSFLLSLIPLYTPRSLKLPTDLMPFVPQFFLPVELPRGTLDEMLKPRPPSEISGMSISVSTLSSRSKQNLAVPDGLGVVELDEVRVSVQSDPQELKDRWERAREKSQRKSQQSAVNHGGAGVGARPSLLQTTSLRPKPRPLSRDVTPKSDLRGELFSLLAPFKNESKAAAAARKKSPSAAASNSSPASSRSPPALSDPPAAASSVRASTTHLLSPISPASVSSPQSAVSPSAVQLSVLSPSPASSSNSGSSPAAASSMDDSDVVSSAAYHELLVELQRKTDALHRISELIEDRPESAAALSSVPPLRFFHSTPTASAAASSSSSIPPPGASLPISGLDEFPQLSPSSSDSSSSSDDDEAGSRPATSSWGPAGSDDSAAQSAAVDSTAGVKLVDSLSRGSSRAGGPRFGRRAAANGASATNAATAPSSVSNGSSSARSLESSGGRRRAAVTAAAASGSQTDRLVASGAADSSSPSSLSASAVAARRAIAHSRILNSPTAKWFH